MLELRARYDGGFGHRARNSSETARKRRVGKVVPAAAVAAAVAAGTAAYGLTSGGAPHASQLNAAMVAHGTFDSASRTSVGNASAAAVSVVKVAEATASDTKPAAKPAATHRSAAPSARATPTHSAPATTPAAAPTATTSASQPTAAAPLSCDRSGGLLPLNVTTIVSFLLDNGYSDNAASGIAGNIYQESKGDPESIGTGGGGLIGWTPLPSGFVTGDVSADLQTQLNRILVYDQGWAAYLPELNAAATPADAAYIYVTDFERAGIPAAYNRETSAEDVASACGI